MGNKGSKGKTLPPGVKYDSEEYWWFELDRTVAPISSCEEYCERFHASPEDYKKGVATFRAFRKKSFPDDPSKDFITREGWLSACPNDAYRKWFELLFNAFDADRNGQFTLEEFLVYDGISDHGSLEQRIMGSFMMCDQNHDHEIKREEMTVVLRTANAMHNKRMPDEKFDHNMDVLMEIVDADRNGTIELGEVIKAARKDERIATIFSTV